MLCWTGPPRPPSPPRSRRLAFWMRLIRGQSLMTAVSAFSPSSRTVSVHCAPCLCQSARDMSFTWAVSRSCAFKRAVLVMLLALCVITAPEHDDQLTAPSLLPSPLTPAPPFLQRAHMRLAPAPSPAVATHAWRDAGLWGGARLPWRPCRSVSSQRSSRSLRPLNRAGWFRLCAGMASRSHALLSTMVPCSQARAGARKRATLSFAGPGPQRLVVLACQVGGRFGSEAFDLVRRLVRVRSLRAPAALRRSAAVAWQHRWGPSRRSSPARRGVHPAGRRLALARAACCGLGDVLGLGRGRASSKPPAPARVVVWRSSRLCCLLCLASFGAGPSFTAWADAKRCAQKKKTCSRAASRPGFLRNPSQGTFIFLRTPFSVQRQ